MKAMNGWVIIEVDKIWNDQTPGGIYKDISFDKHAKVAISGKVISVPDRGSKEVVGEYEYEYPRPENYDDNNYIRNSHFPVTVKKDDIIFFHYLTLEDPHNFLGLSKGKKLYKVGMNYIFCSLREGRIIMHNGYALGKPYYGEGWEEIEVDGKIVAGKIGPGGLIIETKDKPVENVARITNIGKPLKARDRERVLLNRERVQSGTIVLLRPKSEFENEIDGERYWVFAQKDIIGSIHGSRLQPEGDYLMIEPAYKEHSGKIKVNKEYMGYSGEGTVEDIGDLVTDVIGPGASIKFALKRHNRFVDGQEKEHLFVREGEVFGIMYYFV